MKRVTGFTIIQIMAALLVAGIVGSLLVRVLIDKRCESDPSRTICTKNR